MKLIISTILITLILGVSSDNSGCWKSAYGRGVGKAISACAEGLEKDGALCYPPCREGYHGIGPVCWPDESGKAYGRGAGKVLVCKPDEDESGALCYPPCNGNSDGIGPVCWGKCPSTMYVCGALCTETLD